MKALLLILAFSLAASSAVAVVDPDPDMMGIYFDLTADENCLTIGPSIPFFAYLILTNPTSADITAYEFGLELVVPTGMESMVFRLADQTLGCLICFPPYVEILGGDYVVGLASPRPAEPATVLHLWQYMLLAPIRDGEQSGSVDWEKVESLIGCGGIRIEDDVLVTESGQEDLTRPLIGGHAD